MPCLFLLAGEPLGMLAGLFLDPAFLVTTFPARASANSFAILERPADPIR